MNSRDDLRRLRDRQDDYDAALAAGPDRTAPGPPRRVAKTTSDGAYPAARGKFFKLQEVVLTGTESEGTEYTVTDTDTTFYAAHIGDAVPKQGTLVEAVWVPYRWVMLFDGPSQGRGTTVGGAGYPTQPNSWYTVAVQDDDGVPTGEQIMAWNVGALVPPAGSLVLYTYYLSRWEFHYG